MMRTYSAVILALITTGVGACNTSSPGGTPPNGNEISPLTPGGDGEGTVINPPVGGTDPNVSIGTIPPAPAGSVNAYTGGFGQNSFPQGPSLSPNSGFVRYIGRVETNVAGGVRLAWGGSALQVRVTNATNVTITMQGDEYAQNNVVGVLLDGVQNKIIKVVDGVATQRVAIPTGDHLVTFVKRTEAGNGELLISSVTTDGQFEPIAAGTGRLIEFVGDNTTAGYSSDGPLGVTACNQPVNSVADPNMQNAANTYGVLTASAFGADWSLLAFSGRGLVQNFDGSRTMTLGELYPRLNPQEISATVKQSPNAGAVVVNLGSNDINYWMQNKVGVPPNVAGFTTAYVSLLAQIRKLNPNATIIATVGPTLGNYQCITGSSAADYACSAGGTLPALSTLRQAVQDAVAQAKAGGDSKVTFVEFAANSTNVSACYLPDAAGHQAMAKALIPAIATATGWSQGAGATQPAAAAAGTGPKTLSGTFVRWPDALNAANSAAELITNKQYPQCHYCSPAIFNPAFVGTAACPNLLGTSEACQSYCHVPDGFTEMHATNPPTSGNHYSTPAVNASEFTAAVPRAKWIHSLEHGAIVLAYNCPQGCATELSVMRQVFTANNNNGSWIIFTPDPLLTGSRFAALAWTYVYRFDTPDANALNCFIKQHAYYGRECMPKGVASGCSPLLDKPMGSIEG